MFNRTKLLLGCGLTLAVLACSSMVNPAGSDKSALAVKWDNVKLTGEVGDATTQVKKILDISANKVIAVGDFIDQLPLGGWLIVGEIHNQDNVQTLEAALIELLARSNLLGNVAFEMLAEEQQPYVDRWLGKGQDVSADDLHWQSGWGWQYYSIPLRQALDNAYNVIAVEPSLSARNKARQSGPPLGEHSSEHSALLLDNVFKGHCSFGDKTKLKPMVNVQLLRDQNMAQQLAANTVAGKVNILIAGAQHAMKDYGVPLWLEKSGVPYKVILFTESGVPQNYAEYLAKGFEKRDKADYLLFIPPIDKEDFCSQFIKSMQ